MSKQRKQSVGGKPAPQHSASGRKNQLADDRFWSMLHAVVKHAPLADKTRISGLLRSRNLSLVAELCETRMALAVQEPNAETYLAYASLKSAFSKYEGLASPSGEVTALKTWYKAERSCHRANRRMRLTSTGALGCQYIDTLERARKIVHNVLGSFSFSEFAEGCRHGPGVALGLSGLATSGAFKYASGVYTVSPSCANLFRDLVVTDSSWFNLVARHRTELQVVDDCEKLSYVPKNWKTRRTIGVGPLGNVYCQLGIGEMIVSRLKRHGIDLQDQRNNQRAARRASLHLDRYGDDYVTIDLSSASDTMCRELVKFLVPEDWFRVMNAARTQWTLLPDGSKVWLSKFSAMGNGFTFPLETLIFYAISQACMADTVHHNRVWVYGDDIIVPRGCSLWLSETLRWVGFSVNFEKSFFHGDFYESCGTDYLGGVPVRPVYWKRTFRSDRDFYVLVNSYGRRFSGLPFTDWSSQLCADMLRSCVNPILFGPPVEATDGFERPDLDDRVVTDDRSYWRLRVRNGITLCKVFRTAPRRKPVHDDWAYTQVKHHLVRPEHGVTYDYLRLRKANDGEDGMQPVYGLRRSAMSIACCHDRDRVQSIVSLIAPLGVDRDDSGWIRIPIRSTVVGTCSISVS